RKSGRIDLFFLPGNDEDYYFRLECKRLRVIRKKKTDGLALEYVDAGVKRYVDGKYSKAVTAGGMLAFVMDGKVDKARSSVHRRLKKQKRSLKLKRGLIRSGLRTSCRTWLSVHA